MNGADRIVHFLHRLAVVLRVQGTRELARLLRLDRRESELRGQFVRQTAAIHRFHCRVHRGTDTSSSDRETRELPRETVHRGSGRLRGAVGFPESVRHVTLSSLEIVRRPGRAVRCCCALRECRLVSTLRLCDLLRRSASGTDPLEIPLRLERPLRRLRLHTPRVGHRLPELRHPGTRPIDIRQIEVDRYVVEYAIDIGLRGLRCSRDGIEPVTELLRRFTRRGPCSRDDPLEIVLRDRDGAPGSFLDCLPEITIDPREIEDRLHGRGCQRARHFAASKGGDR